LVPKFGKPTREEKSGKFFNFNFRSIKGGGFEFAVDGVVKIVTLQF